MTHRAKDRIGAAALLIAWCAIILWLRWDSWAPDLSALLIAAWLWGHGHADLIYAMPPGFFGGASPDWVQPMAEMGVAGQHTYPYLYPPIWAVVLAPLTTVWSIPTLMNAALVVQVPLLAGSVVLAGRLAKPEAMRWTLWALWGVAVLSLSAPAFLALSHTQPSILMGFVILAAFERLSAGKPATFGALVALAAAIKLSPAVFILAAVLTRGKRAVPGFVVVGGGLALASIALAGWDAHLDMLHSVGAVSANTLMIAINLSVQAIMIQIWLQPSVLPASVMTPQAVGMAFTALPLATIAALVWRSRSWPTEHRSLGALMALSLVVWLLGPLGWLHYYVVPLLLMPGLAMLVPRKTAWGVGVAVVVLSSMPAYLLFASMPGFHVVYPAVASVAWLAVLVALLWPASTPKQ